MRVDNWEVSNLRPLEEQTPKLEALTTRPIPLGFSSIIVDYVGSPPQNLLEEQYLSHKNSAKKYSHHPMCISFLALRITWQFVCV